MSTIVGISAARGTDGTVALQAVVDATPRLDELSTARVIQLIAEAAHGKTVALSPAAIAIEPEGKIRLDAAALTASAYASPEKLRGAPTDRRSDVFSVGVLMWEALTHERLFAAAASDEALAVMVQELEPRAPSESNANIPSELDAIVLKALAKDPGGRYQSLKVMAAEIEAVLSDAGYPETNELIAKFLPTVPRAPAEPKAPLLPMPKVTPREPAAKPGLEALASLPKKPSKAEEEAAAKKAAEARAADEKKAADAKRAAEAKAADDKKAADAKRAAEAKAADDKKAADAKKAAEAKAAEEKRVAEAKAAEEKKAAEARKAAEAKAAEEKKAAEARKAAEAKAAEEAAQAKLVAESKRAADAAEAAKTAAAEAAAAIEAAKAAALKAAEAIKAAESAEASKVEAVKAADFAHEASAQFALPKLDDRATLPNDTIVEAKIDPASFDPGRAALGAPPAGVDVKPLSKAELNRTMMGVAPGPAPAAAPAAPAVLTDAPIAGLPSLPPGAAPTIPPPTVPTEKDVHEAVTQRVPKRGKPETGKNKGKKSLDDSKTTKFEKGETKPDPAAVVALPRSDRASGKIDVWFSSTDSVASIDDEDQFEPHKTRNPLVYIGGAVGAAVVVIVLAIAFSGGSKDKDKKPDGSGSSVAQAKPAEAPPPTPLVPDPNAVPAVGSGSDQGSAQPAVGSGSAEVAPPVTPPPPAPKTAGMACAATTECADGLSCEAGACAAPKPVVPVVVPPVVEKKPPPPVVEKKPPVVAEKKPPPVVEKKPPPPHVPKLADPYANDPKPKVDPQEALRTGLGQYARGETAAALASFRSAIAANGGFAPAYRGMGLVYEKMGNKVAARTAYKKYLALAPTAGDADQIRERMEKL